MFKGLIDVVPSDYPALGDTDKDTDHKVVGPDSSLLLHMDNVYTYKGYVAIFFTIIITMKLIVKTVKDWRNVKKFTRYVPASTILVFLGFLLTVIFDAAMGTSTFRNPELTNKAINHILNNFLMFICPTHQHIGIISLTTFLLHSFLL